MSKFEPGYLKNANEDIISIGLAHNFCPTNFTFISARAQIISNVEGYIIANECSNTPCPQFSFLGDECTTWKMISH